MSMSRTNESCHPCECGMSRMGVGGAKDVSETYHPHEWVMSRTRISTVVKTAPRATKLELHIFVDVRALFWVFVCVHVCVCVCVCVVYVCVCVCVRAHVLYSMHLADPKSFYFACTVYGYEYTCIYMHIYMYTYIYDTYIWKHIHMHVHICIYMCSL